MLMQPANLSLLKWGGDRFLSSYLHYYIWHSKGHILTDNDRCCVYSLNNQSIQYNIRDEGI